MTVDDVLKDSLGFLLLFCLFVWGGGSLHLTCRNKPGKQIIYIYIPEAERDSFPVHSLCGRQSPLVIPQSYRDTKLQGQRSLY